MSVGLVVFLIFLALFVIPLAIKGVVYVYAWTLYFIGDIEERVALAKVSPEVRKEYLERKRLTQELRKLTDDYANFL